MLKDMQPPLEGHELAILEDHPQRSQRTTIRDSSKSPARVREYGATIEKGGPAAQMLTQTPGPNNRPSSRQGVSKTQPRNGSMRQDRSAGNFNVEIFAPDSTKKTTDRGGEADQPAIDLSSQVQAGGKKVSKATLQRRLK